MGADGGATEERAEESQRLLPPESAGAPPQLHDSAPQLTHSACWAVCSCCFASLPQLATLSTIADELAGADSREKAAAHRADRILARGLAQATEFHGQGRAQRAINALRLAALASRAAPPQRCEGWLLEFPAEFSKQNSVLCGVVS